MTGEIRVITGPVVHLVGRPALDRDAVAAHLRAIGHADEFDERDESRSGDAQAIVETGGRTCYQSWSGGRPHAEHVRHLVEVKHHSVLEHAHFVFLVAGVSRNLLAELTRHRHLSFCLAGDTKVYLDRPNRGRGHCNRGPSQTRTLRQLWGMWQDRRRTYVKTMTIRTVTDGGVVVHDHIRAVSASGVKPLFRLTTAAGYTLRASADHLIWRPDGTFTRLGDLSPGDEVMANGRPLLHDPDWVRAQVASGRDTPQIAVRLGVAECTVRKWRRIHGCPADLGSGTVGVRPWNAGKSYRLRDKSKVVAAQAKTAAARRGENSELWRGGPLNWKNGRSAANAIYRPATPDRCQFCGELGLPLEIHHVDGNPNNNMPGNVSFLCDPCHKAKHTGTPPLKVFATAVTSVVPDGEEMTYDIEMAGAYKRFVADGLVVHNSVLSQRYVDHSDFGFVLPPELAAVGADYLRLNWEASCEAALRTYAFFVRVLTQLGFPRKTVYQTARAVLPGCVETRLQVSGNARAWLDFFPKRDSDAADPEIRRLAVVVRGLLAAEMPDVFGGPAGPGGGAT
jgi:thymidylate synthase ThyX